MCIASSSFFFLLFFLGGGGGVVLGCCCFVVVVLGGGVHNRPRCLLQHKYNQNRLARDGTLPFSFLFPPTRGGPASCLDTILLPQS